MDSLSKELLIHVIELQVHLYACVERLRARTDDEALHDLRTGLRRLRSLLRPLRKNPLCASLEISAKAVGHATGPVRDLEVLIVELRRLERNEAAELRQQQLADGYAQVLAASALQRLFIQLDQWPASCRQALRDDVWQLRGKWVKRYWQRQADKLVEALQNPAHDRHRLRLLAKRLRYCAEAWPQLAHSRKSTLQALRKTQSALGDWHDRQLWLERAQSETDLRDCTPVWAKEREQALREGEAALELLAERFAAD